MTDNYYVTVTNAAGDRVIDVSDTILQSIDLTVISADHVNACSVAIDPLDNEIFVPLEETLGSSMDALCPNGCVAVFAVLGAGFTADSAPRPWPWQASSVSSERSGGPPKQTVGAG